MNKTILHIGLCVCLQCVKKVSMETVVRSAATVLTMPRVTRTPARVDVLQAGLENAAINVRVHYTFSNVIFAARCYA